MEIMYMKLYIFKNCNVLNKFVIIYFIINLDLFRFILVKNI